MRRTLLCIVAVSLVSCSDDAQLSKQSPAATLSLVELAGGNAETTFVGVAPRESPPATMFQRIEQALEAGEIDILEADRLVMALRFGGRHELPDEWSESAAESGISDLALFWIMRRLPSYPAEIQKELLSWFPSVRANRVARKAPELNLWPMGVVHASSGIMLETSDQDCVSYIPTSIIDLEFSYQMYQETYAKVDEATVTLAGVPRRVVVCGQVNTETSLPSMLNPGDTALAAQVLDSITQALPEMDTFFAGKLSNSNAFWRDGPAIQFFLTTKAALNPAAAEEGETAAGEEGETATSKTLAEMVYCNRISLAAKDLDPCLLKGTVIHETFHCLDMEARGYNTDVSGQGAQGDSVRAGSLFGRQAQWVSEGLAIWAEDRFASNNNSEWEWYAGMSETPNTALGDRKHDAGIFFTFLDQHAGGDDAIRDAGDGLTTQGDYSPNIDGPPESVLKDRFPWPTTWFEFAEALSGFKPLFEQGRPELTDQPIFPYDETTACGMEGTMSLSQENHAPKTDLEPYQGIFYDLKIPGLSVSYEIVKMTGTTDIQYIDVGFAGDVTDKISSNTLKVTAVLRTGEDDRIVDWSELWLTEGLSAEPIEVPPGVNTESQFLEADHDTTGVFQGVETEGRFRVCLTDEIEGCFDRPDTEIYRDLYEIDIIMANAGTEDEDDIPGGDHSYLVLLPGAMPGWKAIRVEDQPSFEE